MKKSINIIDNEEKSPLLMKSKLSEGEDVGYHDIMIISIMYRDIITIECKKSP